MRIIKIVNQSFESQKLRLPINDIIYTIDGIPLWSKKSNCVKEYSNPNAKQLYEKAKQSHDIKEVMKLYDEMGHYEIKPMNFVEKVNFIEKIKRFFKIN